MSAGWRDHSGEECSRATSVRFHLKKKSRKIKKFPFSIKVSLRKKFTLNFQNSVLFAVLACHYLALDGFDQLLSFLPCPLSAAVHKSQPYWFFLGGNGKNWTWDGWVGSANTTSVRCCPSIISEIVYVTSYSWSKCLEKISRGLNLHFKCTRALNGLETQIMLHFALKNFILSICISFYTGHLPPKSC